jgi:hypothetical protein
MTVKPTVEIVASTFNINTEGDLFRATGTMMVRTHNGDGTSSETEESIRTNRYESEADATRAAKLIVERRVRS